MPLLISSRTHVFLSVRIGLFHIFEVLAFLVSKHVNIQVIVLKSLIEKTCGHSSSLAVRARVEKRERERELNETCELLIMRVNMHC